MWIFSYLSFLQVWTNFYSSVSRLVFVISLRKQNLCHRGSRNAYVFTQKWSGWPFSNMLLENWYFFDWFDFWSKYLVHDPTQYSSMKSGQYLSRKKVGMFFAPVSTLLIFWLWDLVFPYCCKWLHMGRFSKFHICIRLAYLVHIFSVITL